MWNYSWRTGLDEFGEPLHCSMYQHLYTNGPKECAEIPQYTFQQHFDTPIPSFPPRTVFLDYLRGYWRHIRVPVERIKLNHCVKRVDFDEENNVFTVEAKDLLRGEMSTSAFDYLVVASGHFSTPNLPNFKGMDTFRGRILHSHDFRSADEFRGQNVLVVGSSRSASDISQQCLKFGAEKVTISMRNTGSPISQFKWPEKIRLAPIVSEVDANTCTFIDGSREGFHSIILCTGYQYDFPFLPECFKLKCKNSYFLPNLYRGVKWYSTAEDQKSCNEKLFYMGMQNQNYTISMFMIQAKWIARAVAGKLKTPEASVCKQEIKFWCEQNKKITDFRSVYKAQTDYLKRLASDTGYEHDLDCQDLFMSAIEARKVDVLSFRDHVHTSKHSGVTGKMPDKPWMELFDDSIENYVGN